MRRLPELLVLAVWIFSAAVFSRLPARVAGDVSWLLPLPVSTPAREASRVFLAFAIPGVLVVLLAAFRWATSESGRTATERALPSWLGTPGGHPAEYEKFSATMDQIILCIVALVASVHVGFLASALGWDGPIPTVVGLVFGVALSAMGNVMPRLRPNPIAGLRTEAMMRNPVAWRNAHASFGRIWLVGGAVVIATALLAPRYWMIAFIAVLIVSLISAPIVTRRTLDAQHNATKV